MNTIITGASKGIGRALAEKFASEGHHLALCSRHIQDLEALKSELTLKNPGVYIHIFEADVSRKSDVEAFADFCTSIFPVIDVLINNAGVFIPGKTNEEKDGMLELMINTNLYSAYHLTRKLLPRMHPATKPHIFNMCSVASIMAYPNGGSYSISKFALYGYTKVLRQELLGSKIRVSAILPGATWSHSWEGVDLPEDRLMQASDIAESIYSTWNLGPQAVVEEIVIRPLEGDL